MSDLSVWWGGLTHQEHFEVVKIVFDKGILAFLIALAGYWFTRRQESFKAFEVRRLELEKVTFPRVFDLMTKADSLWRDGRNTIIAMDTEFQTKWSPWLDRVIANRSTPIDEISLSRTGAQILESELKSGLTIREHLIAQAADDDTVQRISTVVLSGNQPLFLANLFDFYKIPASPLFSEPRPILLQAFFLDFFRDLTRSQRDAFVQRVTDFLIEAKNVIPHHKKRPMDGVMQGGEAMKFAVVNFPEANGFDNMTTGFLAVSSQLREAIAP